MKFACFSDTHDQGPPEDLWQVDCDNILHAGDIHNRLTRGMTPTASTGVEKWAIHRDKMKIVNGNHDIGDPANIFAECNVTGRIEELSQNLYLVGIGWHGDYYYELPLEKDLTKVCSSVLRQACFRIPNRAHTILLTHYPAHLPETFPSRKKKQEGWFFDCVAQSIKAFRPLAVIQGHAHAMEGKIGQQNNTLIVFPGPKGGILTVDSKHSKAEFKQF